MRSVKSQKTATSEYPPLRPESRVGLLMAPLSRPEPPSVMSRSQMPARGLHPNNFRWRSGTQKMRRYAGPGEVRETSQGMRGHPTGCLPSRRFAPQHLQNPCKIRTNDAKNPPRAQAETRADSATSLARQERKETARHCCDPFEESPVRSTLQLRSRFPE